jgi:hypothetical protein
MTDTDRPASIAGLLAASAPDPEAAKLLQELAIEAKRARDGGPQGFVAALRRLRQAAVRVGLSREVLGEIEAIVMRH